MLIFLAGITEAIPTNESTFEFSSLGILLIFQSSNFCSLDVTIAKYVTICSFVASYSFNICVITN